MMFMRTTYLKKEGYYIMTVGENIRRIRISRGYTQKQLGDLVGVSEAYIRAYEKGRRNPKPKSLQKIAEALCINPEVLKNSEFDSIRAMHQLFQIFRMYGGELKEIPDDNNPEEDHVYITFHNVLMRSWFQRYEEYMEEVKQISSIKNPAEREHALLKAEEDFNNWMDTYPEQEGDLAMLKWVADFDKRMDFYGQNPKND